MKKNFCLKKSINQLCNSVNNLFKEEKYINIELITMKKYIIDLDKIRFSDFNFILGQLEKILQEIKKKSNKYINIDINNNNNNNKKLSSYIKYILETKFKNNITVKYSLNNDLLDENNIMELIDENN
jgi:hypothetical protein